MSVTLYVDLPLGSDATPTIEVRGPWPNETALTGSPFAATAQEYNKGSFAFSLGTPAAGIYRIAVLLSSTLIGTGYIEVKAGTTAILMADYVKSELTAQDIADAITPTLTSQLIASITNRFKVSPNGIATLAFPYNPTVTVAERKSLGQFYVANYLRYCNADLVLDIPVAADALDVAGLLTFTAKTAFVSGVTKFQADSTTGLTTPSGAAGNATVVAIDNPTVGQPSRGVRVTIKRATVVTVSPMRLYFEVKRYVASGIHNDVLATGVLDLSVAMS